MNIVMKRFSVLFLVVVLAACSALPALEPVGLVQSNQARLQAPAVPASDQQVLSAGNTAFGLDLYQTLAGQPGNLFFSPYSISLALAMTYGGARGQTQAQMADALHFNLPPDQLHPAFNALDQQLASRAETGGQGADGKGFRFNIVNDLWGQKDYSFIPEFLDLLAQNYGAGMRPMDFPANPEAARQKINDYIAKQTEDRIQDLLPLGSIDADTRLVLTNAIYFNAAWLNQFEKALTKTAPFSLLDGTQVDVQMMQIAGAKSFAYLRGEDFQAVALPYENNQLSMLVLLPESDSFTQFERSLTGAQLDAIRQQMQWQPVALKMPRFTFESDFSLVDQLKALGMTDAFIPSEADLSGMNGNNELYIADVVHKAFVDVNEAGTEAAAATAVIVGETSAPIDEPIQLTIDRPFLFLIVDEPTNTVLFFGRVVTP
jgi:serpin B